MAVPWSVWVCVGYICSAFSGLRAWSVFVGFCATGGDSSVYQTFEEEDQRAEREFMEKARIGVSRG